MAAASSSRSSSSAAAGGDRTQEVIELANASLRTNFGADMRPDVITMTVQAILHQKGAADRLTPEVVGAFRELGFTVPDADGKSDSTNLAAALRNRRRVSAGASQSSPNTAHSFFRGSSRHTPVSLDDLEQDADDDGKNHEAQPLEADPGISDDVECEVGPDDLTTGDTNDIRNLLVALQRNPDEVRDGEGVRALRHASDWLLTQAAESGGSMLEFVRRNLLANDSKRFGPDTRDQFDIVSLAALVDAYVDRPHQRFSPRQLTCFLFAARYMGYSQQPFDTSWSRAFHAECVPAATAPTPFLAMLGNRLRKAYKAPATTSDSQNGGSRYKRKATGPPPAHAPASKNANIAGSGQSRPSTQ